MNVELYYSILDDLIGRKSVSKTSLTFREISQKLSTAQFSLDNRRIILDCIISRCIYNIDGLIVLLRSTTDALKVPLLDAAIRHSSDMNKVILLSELSEAATEDHIALIADALKRICSTEIVALHIFRSLLHVLPAATCAVNHIAPIYGEIVDKWTHSKKIFLDNASQLIKSAIECLLDELLKPIECDLDGGARKITLKAFDAMPCENADRNFPRAMCDLVEIFYKQATGDTSACVTPFINKLVVHATSPCLVRLNIAVHCCDAVQNIASRLAYLCRMTVIDTISLQHVYSSFINGIMIIIDILGAKPTTSLFTWPWIQIQLWCFSVNRIAQCLVQLSNISMSEKECGNDLIFVKDNELDYHEIAMLSSIARNAAYNPAFKPGTLVLLHNSEKLTSDTKSYILNYLAAVCNNSSLLFVAYTCSRIVMHALHVGHEHLGICVAQLTAIFLRNNDLGSRIIVSSLVLWISESPLKEKNSWSSMSNVLCALMVLVSEHISPFKIIEDALQYIYRTFKCVVSIEECCVSQPGLIVAAMVFLCTASGMFSLDAAIYCAMEKLYDSDKYHGRLVTNMLEWSCALCESYDDVPLVALQQLNAILKSISYNESTSVDIWVSRMSKLINKKELHSPRNLDSLSQLKKSHRVESNDYLSCMRNLISQVQHEVDVVCAVSDIYEKSFDDVVSVYQAINTLAYSDHSLALAMKSYLLPCSHISKLMGSGIQTWELLFHDVYDIRPHLQSAIVCCHLRLLSFLSVDIHNFYFDSMLAVDLGAVTVVAIHALRSLFHSVDQRSSEYQKCLSAVRRHSHVININVLQQALQYFIAYMTLDRTTDEVHNASLYAHVCVDIAECLFPSEHVNFAVNIVNSQMYQALIVHFLKCYGRENDDSVEHLLQIILQLCSLAHAKSENFLIAVSPLWALVSLAHHCDFRSSIDDKLFVADLLPEESTHISTGALSLGVKNVNEGISVLYVQSQKNRVQPKILKLYTDGVSYPYSINMDITDLKFIDTTKTEVVVPFLPTMRSLFDALRYVSGGPEIEMVVYYLLRYVYLPLECNSMIGLLHCVFREVLLADHEYHSSNFERHVSIQLFVLKRLLYEKTPRQHPLLWIFSSLSDAIDASSESSDPISLSSIMQFLNIFSLHELQSTVSLVELSTQLKKTKSSSGSKYNSVNSEIEASCAACVKFIQRVLCDDKIIKDMKEYPQAISFIIVSLVAYVDISTNTSFSDAFSKMTSVSLEKLLANCIHSMNNSLTSKLLRGALHEYSRCYSWSTETIALYKCLLDNSRNAQLCNLNEKFFLSEENRAMDAEETPVRHQYTQPLGLSPEQRNLTKNREDNAQHQKDILRPVKLEISEDGIPDAPNVKIEGKGASSIELSVNNSSQKYHLPF